MIREEPTVHIILHNPKIPQNTGNIGRMCSILGARLHLIHPLGFIITDSKLKRSGMDYWHELDIVHHKDWNAFRESALAPKRLWLLTTKSQKGLWDADFKSGDGLVFGAEDCGCPQYVHDDVGERCIKIPQFAPKLRSLNLSTAAGIAAYEAMRQITTNIDAG